MSEIAVTYDLACEPAQAPAVARAIALEQSVEVPAAVLQAANVPDDIVGDIGEISPVGDDSPCQRVTIRYRADLAAGQLSQLLNLIYGNISIQNKIRIVDIHLPEGLLARFPGPRCGEAGLRRLLGVYDRPLLATAIKPRGAALEHLVGIARAFALGGGDLVKDDHNLVDAEFDSFQKRVGACQQAVVHANRQTGRNTLYLPMLMPPLDELDRHVTFLAEIGVRGVLVCPYIVGPDVMRTLSHRHGLLCMAHPAFSGTFLHDPDHGIAPHILLGTLMRLAGADASVFPNHGGRFAFTAQQCRDIGRALTEPLGDLAPALPVPAGGMRFENLRQMTAMYGDRAIFLIGGALLSHSDNLVDGVRAFLERISADHAPRYVEPQESSPAGPSSCDIPAAVASQIREHLRFDGRRFAWEGRDPIAYKDCSDLPFAGVTRVELLGRAGEPSAFELRYFEIAPGGYSSLERHRHIHAVIAVRGQGELVVHDRATPLAHLDIAYVPPMATHQLRATGDEPFGFFCIVDKDRDRPQAP